MASAHKPRSGSPAPRPGEVRPDRTPNPQHLHHRQTSIVNGLPHRSGLHSRQGSYVNSPATSPLSPLPVMHATISPTDTVHIPQINSYPSTPMTPMMSIASVTNQPTQIQLPQIPDSPVSSAPPNTNPGALNNTANSLPGGVQPVERPGLFPQRSTPAVMQVQKPPRWHHPSSSSFGGHHHSKSREDETKTPAEYALHILFTQFVRLAERKVNSCLPPNHPLDREPDIESICGAGVDPAFDKLIGSLGYIARHKPKPVIDSLMIWRKSKSDAARQQQQQQYQQQYQQYQDVPRGHHLLSRRNTDPNHPLDPSMTRESTLVADRRTTVAIYILCRVLIEVIGQTTLDRVTDDMARLEEIIFNQLRSADPDVLATSPLRYANWTLFSQLLGVMSSIDFERVTDQFFQALETTPTTKEYEAKTALIVRGMSYIKLKFYPENVLEECADFMVSLAKFFNNAHGPTVKTAFCEIFSKLLLPVASTADTELNHPVWQKFVNSMFPKLNEMMSKPRHWHHAFTLMGTMLCVSPCQLFTQQWMALIDSNLSRLRDKDRSMRVPVVQTIARLTWTYLFRCSETLSLTTKKLEKIISIILSKDRREKPLVTSEQQVVEPCIQLIRFIGFKHQDLCFRTVIFPLLNVDQLTGPLRLQDLSPEGMMVGIRAFLAIITDLEKGDAGQPPFPITFASSPAEKIAPTSTWLAKIEQDKKDGLKLQIDRRSQAVATDKLGETAREYYDRFCEVLGTILVLCDNNFGGQVVLDERSAPIPVPRTPSEPSFLFRDRSADHAPGWSNAGDQNKSFYDLLRVAITAVPRCLPRNIPLPKIISLLCKGTAHIDPAVAAASAEALKSIARQCSARQVMIGFARFVFAFDEKYSTKSNDGGMLGSAHIEDTLKLYIDLLTIWLDALKQRAKGSREAAAAALETGGAENGGKEDFDYEMIRAEVDEVESNGLFFLCSQNRVVRRFAIMVLRTVVEFDVVLVSENGGFGRRGSDGESRQRVIHILESDSLSVMNLNEESLPIAERSRLQRELKGSKAKDALVQMALSDNHYDASLWFRIFPSLIRVCFERCSTTVMLCRDLVCGRLLQMQQGVFAIAQSTIGHSGSGLEYGKPIHRVLPSTSPEVMIEQWKLYLIVACSTLTSSDGESTPRPRTPQHSRKQSKNSVPLAPYHLERITSARAVFQMVIHLLSVDNQVIREAVVAGLGSINVNLYKTLIESLQPTVLKWGVEDKRHRPAVIHGASRRNRRQDRLRAEVTHIFQLTSHFLREESVYRDAWILRHMVAFIKDMKTFLSDPEVQQDWEQQRLRRYFCGLTEELYEGIKMTGNPEQWLPFEGRLSIFNLMQDWCGHGGNSEVVRQREELMRKSLIETKRGSVDGGTLNAAMEIEKRNLMIAALSAMASLCAGPVVERTEGGLAMLSFNVETLFKWIEHIFTNASDRTHRIGRRALRNILIHNQKTSLLDDVIRLCYVCDPSQKMTQSYFSVICEVLREWPDYVDGIWKIMTLCLYKLGDDNADIRLQAAKLLRLMEEKEFGVSRVQDFEVSISDKTVAVYKRAQFQLSKTLSIEHSELAVFVFSELTMFFNLTDNKPQRDILHALLPWIQRIELQTEPSGELSPASYMVLVNLYEMTVKYSNKIHSEIQAVWQSLSTAPFMGNVQAILNFILNNSLERREQNFVEFGKQIVVFLSETPAGAKLVEALMMYLQPKLMKITLPEPSPVPNAAALYPYVADLSKVIPEGGKQPGFSYGHLGMILLVDLLVGPVPEMAENLTLLLQVVFVLWDHFVQLVQEQAKELLIHLIHELIIPSLNAEEYFDERAATLEFIETVRNRDEKTYWAYDEIASTEESGLRVPVSMEFMITSVLEMFNNLYPGLKEEWGKLALSWATTCRVRHLACRSFQVFRCLLTKVDHAMLSDMMARLSNTIADDVTDIRLYSMEILITLNAIVTEEDTKVEEFPQIFWVTVACLNTIHEQEFMEVLSMLDTLLDKIDLSDPEKVTFLLEAQPPKWVGKFEGLQSLIDKGLRSSVCLPRTLKVLDKLTSIPTNDLIGDDTRLLFAILANLPRFSHEFESGPSESVLTTAKNLQHLADNHDAKALSRCMSLYSTQRFRSRKDFITKTVTAVRETFFPEYEAQALIFLVGLLSNKLPWMKLKTMELLTVMVPHIDMRKPAFVGVGADLISPLLRLLQTDYVEQALEVLDKMLTLSGGPMDHHVVRMSLGNRTIRKEYEKTQTLFGIPDESGWAIPCPALNVGSTRDNVHAVFYTCTPQAPAESPGLEVTPDVQFHMEDYSYTALPDRTATMLSEDGRGEGGFSDTVLRLGDLDAFFGSDDEAPSPPSQKSEYAATETGDSAPQLYDNRVYAILNRSLARTPSVSSFHGSFADSLSPTPERPGIMTPTAFTAPPPQRGWSTSRSVSSPQLAGMARFGGGGGSESEGEGIVGRGKGLRRHGRETGSTSSGPGGLEVPGMRRLGSMGGYN